MEPETDSLGESPYTYRVTITWGIEIDVYQLKEHMEFLKIKISTAIVS